MKKPEINTSKKVIPMIYAYTTPEIKRHDGWTKIGYTEKDVIERIKEQTHTADIEWNLEWKGNAIYEDGTGERFTDKEFHAYLRKDGVEQEEGKNNEWFHINGVDSHKKFNEYRVNRGILEVNEEVVPYNLRTEQECAVSMTVNYMKRNGAGEFLWNAKPRFGKTLTAYDFVKKMNAQNVLIVTNRPAIANSWYSDYMKFLGTQSGYLFVSEVDALKGKKGVLSRKEFVTALNKNFEQKCIEFVSLQDLKGSKYFSEWGIEKLREVADMNWDILIVDEAHEGVDTYKTDIAFDRIKRKYTLHLSGTPFKALANNKFSEDAIYNWTYADEQKMKHNWDASREEENPYEILPQLNLYTYQMSEIVKSEIEQGIEIDGEVEEYAFDLNEFFSTSNGKFKYDKQIDLFLDSLSTGEKFPFSTDELRNEIKHSFWLLDRVESAKCLAQKLQQHPIFKDYEVVLVAGDGLIDDTDEFVKSYDKVIRAIEKYDKTITISVGQLTTGITIPEWSAVLMLSNVKSPSLYMQAAFRSQNPCLYYENGIYKRKENAYVFDFDPARTLNIFEEFANDLLVNTSNGKGDVETRKKNIKELLNFFPVIGEDENGELIQLDAEKVLTIPRKIRSVEVVKRGFMSDFLFQNISNIFRAPSEVIDLITQFEPVEEPALKRNLHEELNKDISLDDDGNVSIDEDYIIGKSAELFGEKIYDSGKEIVENTFDNFSQDNSYSAIEKLKESIKDNAIKTIMDTVNDAYGNDIKISDKKQIENKLNNISDRTIDKIHGNYVIEKNIVEQERNDALQSRFETGKTTEEINKEFDEKQGELDKTFKDDITSAVEEFIKKSSEETIETVETNIKEREKDSIETSIRDHLRGFSRTIPSFLMAYGDNTITLSNFDSIIPDNVFKEVTSISLEQFKFLRDGGIYYDSETGEEKEFKGHLFDEVVFDDSVKEFMNKKISLANYFEETNKEDIFDYIPPQKTNQIYTPKKVVKQMIDLLEKENPGCFDDPNKTFMDLYMKSGLYITEIVKKLFNSKKIKEIYPDENERLNHIFANQVYGLAPTEIIYRIALSYILGFSKDINIEKHNLKQLDSLKCVINGNLEDKLDELFDNKTITTYKNINDIKAIEKNVVNNVFPLNDMFESYINEKIIDEDTKAVLNKVVKDYCITDLNSLYYWDYKSLFKYNITPIIIKNISELLDYLNYSYENDFKNIEETIDTIKEESNYFYTILIKYGITEKNINKVNLLKIIEDERKLFFIKEYIEKYFKIGYKLI